MLTTDQREMTVPGGCVYRGDGDSWFRRILVPVRAPDESCPALAVAARICALGNGVLRLVHVRTCDPPLPIAGRFYLETAGEAAAVLEEALLMTWAYGGAAGHHGRGGCPAIGCGRGDRAAGGRMAR